MRVWYGALEYSTEPGTGAVRVCAHVLPWADRLQKHVKLTNCCWRMQRVNSFILRQLFCFMSQTYLCLLIFRSVSAGQPLHTLSEQSFNGIPVCLWIIKHAQRAVGEVSGLS